jgi:hypothetical protein
VDGPSANSSPQQQNLQRLFKALVKDADRDLGGVIEAEGYRVIASSAVLPPFPMARDPPPPVSAERVQEILADPRVGAQQSREATASTGAN